MNTRIISMMLLVVVMGMMAVMPATAATATRTLPVDCVNAGENFTVTIEADNYGSVGAVIETLCDGWEYQSTTATDAAVDGNTVSFMLAGSGPTTFTYTVSAPAVTGACCGISGVIRDEDTQDYTVTGATEVCVCGDPLDPISATRDISDQTVNPESTFTVTLTLTANEDLQAPTLDENLPAGWTVTAVLNDGATYKAASTEWVWTTAMPSGETKLVIYDVTVPADAMLHDYNITGQASAYNVSPATIGGKSVVTVEPGTAVDPVSATRDISDQTVNPGSTFTVTLTLAANEDIQAPMMDENLPTGWAVTDVDNGGATYKAASTEWVWTTAMPSGETRTVIYNVTMPASATPKDLYYITGQVSAYNVSPVAISGESTVTVTTLCGDVNHDGILSTADVIIALQMAASSTDIDSAADMNADGVVTSVDALMIWQAMIS
ncbi:MAG: dockerin type I domain-containing protein [Euryarchaeota archaeon]|nr:dockerin type I domain-containing protein [Euryarchaeota archaeon]